MKNIFLFVLAVLLLSVVPSYAQTPQRYEGVVQSSSGPYVTFSPYSTVVACNYPTIYTQGSFCTNRATTYTDVTLNTPCPTNAQSTTFLGGPSCSGASDGKGNFGFWVNAGTYTYMVQVGTTISGPFYINNLAVGGLPSSARVNTSSPLTGGGLVSGNPTLGCNTASGSQTGCLSSTDWSNFNSKQTALGFTPLNSANNLSDIVNAATSRTNLGLGTAAVHPATDFMQAAANLAELTNTATARTNLGLGTAATQNVGAFTADPGSNGIVKRTASGTAAVAGQTDIINTLLFTPENIVHKNANSGYAGLDSNGSLNAPLGGTTPNPSAVTSQISTDVKTYPITYYNSLVPGGDATAAMSSIIALIPQGTGGASGSGTMVIPPGTFTRTTTFDPGTTAGYLKVAGAKDSWYQFQSNLSIAPAAVTISNFSITSNVATLTTSSQAYAVNQTIRVAGLTTATYLNGLSFQLTSATSNSVVFPLGFTHVDVGSTPDTGTINTPCIADSYHGFPDKHTFYFTGIGVQCGSSAGDVLYFSHVGATEGGVDNVSITSPSGTAYTGAGALFHFNQVFTGHFDRLYGLGGTYGLDLDANNETRVTNSQFSDASVANIHISGNTNRIDADTSLLKNGGTAAILIDGISTGNVVTGYHEPGSGTLTEYTLGYFGPTTYYNDLSGVWSSDITNTCVDFGYGNTCPKGQGYFGEYATAYTNLWPNSSFTGSTAGTGLGGNGGFTCSIDNTTGVSTGSSYKCLFQGGVGTNAFIYYPCNGSTNVACTAGHTYVLRAQIKTDQPYKRANSTVTNQPYIGLEMATTAGESQSPSHITANYYDTNWRQACLVVTTDTTNTADWFGFAMFNGQSITNTLWITDVTLADITNIHGVKPCSNSLPYVATKGTNTATYSPWPLPAPNQTGQVFSDAGASNQWISAVNTDGTFTKTQPASTNLSDTAVMMRTNQANTITAGNKLTVASNATTAGFNFAGVTSDPSGLAAGDEWFRSNSKHLFFYDGTTTQQLGQISDFAAPPALGNTTPNTGAFTTFSTTSTGTFGGHLGVGVAAPGSIIMQVRAGSSGATANGGANVGVFEASGANGISVLTPDVNTSTIALGSPTNAVGGAIEWNFTNKAFQVGTNAAGGFFSMMSGAFSEGARLNQFGEFLIGTTTGTGGTTKLTVNGGINTNTQFTSTLATGTPPFSVSSTTPVTNLNIGGNAATATTATNLATGLFGAVPYQTATATTGFLSSPTTNGHTFFMTWQPLGGGVAPFAMDAATFMASPPAIGGTAASTGAFTSISSSGQITSTVATGTPPLVVSSTTNVANLNAASVNGKTMAAPGPIGGTTPDVATFTSVTVPSSGTDTSAMLLSGGTTTPSGFTGATNVAAILGPNSGTFTKYGLQMSTTGPAGAGYAHIGAPSSSISQVTFGAIPTGDVPATFTTVSSGAIGALSASNGAAQFVICTATCSVTPISPPAQGYQLCVIMRAGVTGTVTLNALANSALYPKTDYSGFGTAGTGTMVSTSATGNSVCLVGSDATHYELGSFHGTYTTN